VSIPDKVGWHNASRLRPLTTLGVAAACLVAIGGFAAAAQAPKVAAQKPMPLIDLDGYRKLVADHRGKPLLITFWATWCEPCRDEYPLVNTLAKQYAPQGLTVVGVDMDDDAEINLVRHFLEKNQPIFPNVRKKMGHVDAFQDGVDPNWHGTMPANFFYAADGRLLGFIVGEHSRDDFEKIIHAILSAPHS
jgi:thiol-disulfide isomerase/thioredoxin